MLALFEYTYRYVPWRHVTHQGVYTSGGLCTATGERGAGRGGQATHVVYTLEYSTARNGPVCARCREHHKDDTAEMPAHAVQHPMRAWQCFWCWMCDGFGDCHLCVLPCLLPHSLLLVAIPTGPNVAHDATSSSTAHFGVIVSRRDDRGQ